MLSFLWRVSLLLFVYFIFYFHDTCPDRYTHGLFVPRGTSVPLFPFFHSGDWSIVYLGFV